MSHDSDRRNRLSRIRRESDDDESTRLAGYVTGSGEGKTWQGDDEAPYVKVIWGSGDDGIGVQGTVAHDDPDADNPVKVGGYAQRIA